MEFSKLCFPASSNCFESKDKTEAMNPWIQNDPMTVSTWYPHKEIMVMQVMPLCQALPKKYIRVLTFMFEYAFFQWLFSQALNLNALKSVPHQLTSAGIAANRFSGGRVETSICMMWSKVETTREYHPLSNSMTSKVLGNLSLNGFSLSIASDLGMSPISPWSLRSASIAPHQSELHW